MSKYTEIEAARCISLKEWNLISMKAMVSPRAMSLNSIHSFIMMDSLKFCNIDDDFVSKVFEFILASLSNQAWGLGLLNQFLPFIIFPNFPN